MLEDFSPFLGRENAFVFKSRMMQVSQMEQPILFFLTESKKYGFSMKEMSCPAADEDKNEKKNVTSASDEALKEADLEIICDYDSATREIFELILWDRKEALSIKDSYQSVKVDLTKYPQWTDSVVSRR
jgi:hypothetical protein